LCDYYAVIQTDLMWTLAIFTVWATLSAVLVHTLAIMLLVQRVNVLCAYMTLSLVWCWLSWLVPVGFFDGVA
jgi:hypothetical protein